MIEIKQESFGMLAANSYLVTDHQSRESVLIDCPKFSIRMQQFLSGAAIKYVLLTHAHFDHVAGCAKLLRQMDVPCLLSGRDIPLLLDPDANLSKRFFQKCDTFPVEPLEAHQDDLKIGETRIRVISTPGHTPGSVSYRIENSLFTGDTLMANAIGKTDFPFGSERDMADSLRLLCKLDGVVTVFPGHEGNTTLEKEKKNNPWVRELV